MHHKDIRETLVLLHERAATLNAERSAVARHKCIRTLFGVCFPDVAAVVQLRFVQIMIPLRRGGRLADYGHTEKKLRDGQKTELRRLFATLESSICGASTHQRRRSSLQTGQIACKGEETARRKFARQMRCLSGRNSNLRRVFRNTTSSSGGSEVHEGSFLSFGAREMPANMLKFCLSPSSSSEVFSPFLQNLGLLNLLRQD